MIKQIIIAQGAEALLIKSGNEVIKKRIKKSYRLPKLDIKLRRQRTRREFKLLQKASKIIPVPKITKIFEYDLTLDFIKGKKLSDNLDSLKNALGICNLIGQNIAKLHDSNIIHGDLTTSNMIYVDNSQKSNNFNKKHKDNSSNINNINNASLLNKDISTRDNKNKVYFIDFGLGFESLKIEDKATDLHVLKEALEARHFKNADKFWPSVLKGYKISKNFKEAIKRLEKVEKRGRYKTQY